MMSYPYHNKVFGWIWNSPDPNSTIFLFFSGPKSNLDILEKDYVYDVYCADDSYGALSEV